MSSRAATGILLTGAGQTQILHNFIGHRPDRHPRRAKPHPLANDEGIYISGTDNSLVSGNIISGIAGVGILLQGYSAGNQITANPGRHGHHGNEGR